MKGKAKRPRRVLVASSPPPARPCGAVATCDRRRAAARSASASWPCGGWGRRDDDGMGGYVTGCGERWAARRCATSAKGGWGKRRAFEARPPSRHRRAMGSPRRHQRPSRSTRPRRLTRALARSLSLALTWASNKPTSSRSSRRRMGAGRERELGGRVVEIARSRDQESGRVVEIARSRDQERGGGGGGGRAGLKYYFCVAQKEVLRGRCVFFARALR